MINSMTIPLAAMGPYMTGAILVGVVVLVGYAILNTVHDLRSTGRQRLAERLQDEPTASQGRDTARKDREERLRKRLAGDTGALDKLLTRFGPVQRIQRLIDQCDLTWMASHVITGQVVAAAVVVAIGVVAKINIGITVGVAAAILILPIVYLAMKRRKRRNTFMFQLPDVFELMSQALRAGHGLASAIQVVSDQMPDPVGNEFGRVYNEQNLGIRVEDALMNMAERVDLLDLRFFVTAVMIQRTTGGDLAEILEKISDVIRGRIELFGQVAALTAEGRMSGYVLLSLPFVVGLASLWINPTYLQDMIAEDLGRYMLYAAGFFQLLGYVMIKKIVNIKV